MEEAAKWDSAAFPGCGHESDAIRTDNGLSVYRHWLERRWSQQPAFILWVMFNPSKATVASDHGDLAVGRCFKRSQLIAERTGIMVGAMRVVNLFARRATDTKAEGWPRGAELNDPAWIGPDNDAHIAEQATQASLVIVGWGASLVRATGSQWRADQVEASLTDPWCLDHPGDGHPYFAGERGAGAQAGIVQLSEARARSLRA